MALTTYEIRVFEAEREQALILFLLGLFGALFGIGGVAEVRSNEHSAATEFQKHLGPEAKVRVRFRLSGIASLHGDLASVSVRASNFKIEGLPWFVDPSQPHDGRIKRLELHLDHGTAHGYGIDSLSATLPEVRYDFKAARRHRGFVLSACGQGTFRIELSEQTAALDAMQRNSSISESKVILMDDRMVFAAVAKTGLAKVPIRVEGRVAERDGHLVTLEDSTVLLGGKPLSPEAAKSILGQMNPLMDFDKDFGQPGLFRLTGVHARDHRLILEGTLRLPVKPSSDSAPAPGVGKWRVCGLGLLLAEPLLTYLGAGEGRLETLCR